MNRLARSMLIVRAPTLVQLQDPLIRLFSGLIFYLLLPKTMLLFAWNGDMPASPVEQQDGVRAGATAGAIWPT